MTLDHDAIHALLPHRPPILLPRSVEIRTAGESGIGRIELDLETPLWGEWRARDLFRELVLEGAAQVLGLVLASERAGEPEDPGEGRHLLLGFAGVEFAPGAKAIATFEIEAARVQDMGAMCRGRFIARHGVDEIAHGELTVMQE